VAVRVSDDRDPSVLSGQGPVGRLAAVDGRGVAPLRPQHGVHDRGASGRRSNRARLDLGTGITTRGSVAEIVPDTAQMSMVLLPQRSPPARFFVPRLPIVR